MELILSDGSFFIYPIIFGWLVNEYSPLKYVHKISRNAVSVPNLSIRVIAHLIKWFGQGHLPSFTELVKSDVIADIHAITAFVDYLSITYYDVYFKKISRLIDATISIGESHMPLTIKPDISIPDNNDDQRVMTLHYHYIFS